MGGWTERDADGYRWAWMDGGFGSPGVLPSDGAEVADTTGNLDVCRALDRCLEGRRLQLFGIVVHEVVSIPAHIQYISSEDKG